MLKMCKLVLFGVVVLWNQISWAGSGPDSTSLNIIRSTIMDYFNPYPNASPAQNQDVLNQLLDTRSQSDLAFPAFPRTWVELSSTETYETDTKAFFDTGKLAFAITTLAPLSKAAALIASYPVQAFINGAQIGYRYEKGIRYSYNKETTFMAMTSLRPIDPQAKSNQQTPMSPASSGLRAIIEQRADLRNYFKVSPQFPMVGLCKYEMNLTVEQSDQKTLSFLVGSNSDSQKIVARSSYTVYSNFFQIESHVPAQEYLRTRCGENFTEAVRFLVEQEFNKLVTETFAYYHPKSQCRWSPSTVSQTPGDQDCQNWFDKLNVMGIDKKENVPRCILGEEGYPVCVARSKMGMYCPIFASRATLSTKEPIKWDRQLNPMDNSGTLHQKLLQECDVGLTCKLDNGMSISQIPLPKDERERMRKLSNASFVATCQRSAKQGRQQ